MSTETLQSAERLALCSGLFRLARTSMLDTTADLAKHRAASDHSSGWNRLLKCLIMRRPCQYVDSDI
jgi:hypothetical protein